MFGMIILLICVGLSGCNEQTDKIENYQPYNPEQKYIEVTGTYYGTINTEIISEGLDRYEIHDIKIGDSIYSIYVDSYDYFEQDSIYYKLIGLDSHHVGKTVTFKLIKYSEWYLVSSYEIIE